MARDRDDEYTDRPRKRRAEDSDDRPRGRRRDDDDDDDRPRRRRDEYDDDDDRPRRRRPDMEHLREVASAQRGIIYCILAQLLLGCVQGGLMSLGLNPDQVFVANIVMIGVYLVIGITAAVFVFVLALRVYSTATGVFMGILVLVPLIGLIVLVILNQKAIVVLKDGGVRMGFMGAKSEDLERD